MKFLYPNILYFLIFLAVPIIIHLFRFRLYKTVYFSNVGFIKQVKKEHKTKSNLKKLLVLICRLISMSCIVIAFAQPYFGDTKMGKEVVAVYIDNSFSMNSNSKEGRLLDNAKINAKKIIQSFRHNAEFHIRTNDNLTNSNLHKFNKNEVTDEISKIENSTASISIDNVLKELQTIKDLTRIYILSDFQKNSCDISKLKTEIPTWFMHYKSQEAKNIYIDSCWVTHPVKLKNRNSEICVKIVNISDLSYDELPVNLYLHSNNKYELRAFGKTDIKANSTNIVKLSFPNPNKNIALGKVEINDYPIVYDNTFYFSYLINDNIKILEIANSNSVNSFKNLYSVDSSFFFKRVFRQNFNYANLNRYDLIITNGFNNFSEVEKSSLKSYVANSGKLTIIPPINVNRESYNSFLSSLGARKIKGVKGNSQINYINTQSQFYRGAFRKIKDNFRFPKIKQMFVLENGKIRNNETILLKETGNLPVLTSFKYKKGFIYFSAVNLSNKSEDLSKHPFVVPSLINTALKGNETDNIALTSTNLSGLQLSTVDSYIPNTVKLSNLDNIFSVIPTFNSIGSKIKINIAGQKLPEGNYMVTEDKNNISCFSLNINRKESEQKFHTLKDLKNKPDRYITPTNKSTDLMYEENENSFWKLFILLCIIFIGIETAILRFMK